MSDQDMKHSDLVEIAKCSGDLKRNYGAMGGALLIAWMAHLTTRSRPILGRGWLIIAIYTAWRHWLG